MTLLLSILHYHLDKFNLVNISISVMIGVSYGVLLAILVHWHFQRLLRIEVNLPEGDDMLFEGVASYKSNKKYIPGKLVLTNSRLIFKALKHAKLTEQLEVQLPAVEEFTIGYSARINPNKLILQVNGMKEMFALPMVKQWVSRLKLLQAHHS